MSSEVHRTRLIDLANDWFAVITALRQSSPSDQDAPLLAQAQELRTRFENDAQTHGCRADDVRNALFALAAFYDESVMASLRDAAHKWATRKLQFIWFKTNTAGEEFFQRLEELRRDRERCIEGLEVFAGCIALGFCGKYTSRFSEREELLRAIWRDIEAVRGRTPRVISPPPIVPPPEPRPGLPSRWVIGAAFAAMLVLIWLVAFGCGNRRSDSVETDLEKRSRAVREAES